MGISSMAKQTHIYLYGDIFNYQGKDANEFGCVNLKYVADILNANSDAEEFIVHIHSRGGDVNEGFAIHDLLFNSGKKITTIIDGLCASIATVVALAGSVRKISQNAEFMIHNAWADPYNMTGFNADDYAEMADFIRDADEKILTLYIQKTGKPAEDIQAFMKAETYLSAEQALELGFVTEIQEQLKAVAYLKPQSKKQTKPQNKMSLKTTMAAAKKVLMALAGLQAAESTLSDGSMIHYAEDSLTEGTLVFTDPEMNTPVADGDITLDDGTVLTVKAGAIESIVDANPDAEALQARVDELEAENLELRTLNDEAEVVINNLSTKMTALAAVKSTGKPVTSANNPSKFRTNQNVSSDSRFNDRKKGGTK